MTEDWRDISTCPKTNKRDARPIMAWHAFQGAVITDTFQATENSFNVYWRDLPYLWYDPRVKPPTPEDADSMNCVAVIDRYGILRMAGYRYARDSGSVNRWAPCPKPPPDARGIRERFTRRKL